MGSNFAFLAREWPAVAFEAKTAERKALNEPRESLFRARRAIEALVEWMCLADPGLVQSYKADLSARLHEATFVLIADEDSRLKLHRIRRQGNAAAHWQDALRVPRELYDVCLWFAARYGVIGLFPDESDVVDIVARVRDFKQSAIAT